MGDDNGNGAGSDAAWQALLAEMQARAAQMGRQLPADLLNPAPGLAPGLAPAQDQGQNGGPAPMDVNGVMQATAAFNANAGQPHGQGFPGFGTQQHGAPSRTNSHHSSQPAPRQRNEFERVTGDIPIEKFPYGEPGADWSDWAVRFEKAVKAATNAYGQVRLGELCLMWISLKLPEAAQPIYNKCRNKDADWDQLKIELEEGLEDPKMRRDWVRNVGAYKKPQDISLQVYRAKVTGYVHKYSPAVVNDTKAYNEELYNRFVHGLEVDWREYIEESIPYGKETIDNAYNQALKYEAKLEKKQVQFTGAAMTDSEKDTMERIRLDVEELKTNLSSVKKKSRQERGSWSGFQKEDRRSASPSGQRSRKDYKNDFKKGRRSYRNSPHHRSRSRTSSSGRSGSSTAQSRSSSGERFRAIRTEDEDSDTEAVQQRAKVMTEAITKAITEGMKGMSMKSRKGSSKHRSRSKKD